MIELARHISLLLRTHDCVVIPGFGGILAYRVEASYDEHEQVFRSPERRIGFNACLKHNDGVLVQSYASAYGITAEEALSRIQKVVASIRQQLQSTGRVALRGVGDFSCNIKGGVVFTPYRKYILTPSYYGLENFTIATLATPSLIEFVPRSASVYKGLANRVVAAVVAFVLLFTFVLPGDNDDNVGLASSTFATLQTEHKQSQPRRHTYEPRKVSEVKFNGSTGSEPAVPAASTSSKSAGATTSTTAIPADDVPAQRNDDLSGDAKDSNKVKSSAAAPSVAGSGGVTASRKTKDYYVIAASLPTMETAEQYLSDYKAKGFQDAAIVKGNGRFRIAVARFDNRQDAESRISDLRKNDSYKDVWLLME